MLTIAYKDGTRRFLNVGHDFYRDGKTGEIISKSYLTDKVTDLISDLGPYKGLFHCILSVGQQKMVEIGPNLHNSPIHEPEPIIDYSEQLKDLKVDTKNFRFTQRILRNSDGVFVTPIDEEA